MDTEHHVLTRQTQSPQASIPREANKMAETNFFESPNGNAGTNAGWGAGIGGLIGAAVGNGGLFGNNNREQVATLDQVDSRFNNLSSQLNTESLQGRLGDIQGQINNSTAAATLSTLGAIGNLKDSVQHADTHNQLALCGLGHNVTAGFAATNFNIQQQGAQSRELALQQALDAERARATELRIALSEHKNQAGHQATQVLLQQVINAK